MTTDGAVFFANYWRAVEHLLSANPRQKTSALRLSETPVQGVGGATLVHTLREALGGPWWPTPCTKTSGNWVWRKAIPTHLTESPEVVLERELMSATARTDWTCQMSTSSGLRGPGTDKRRAIDLVQRVNDQTFRFIELKIGSDNPLYAAFEVLGYGLAYLLARKDGYSGSGAHNVMKASRIELVVLAPRDWFDPQRIDLSWLLTLMNQGLAEEPAALQLAGLDAMTISFSPFEYRAQRDLDVAAVLRTLSVSN